jgi:CHASE2 domain-containing sensor protein/signal transduction histidine kinase
VQGSSRDGNWTILLLIATLVVLVLSGVTSRLDQLLYDLTQRSAPRPTPANILIVAIDDESLLELGAWPWPRDRHRQLLDRLAVGQPRAVIYDTLLLKRAEGESDIGLAKAMTNIGSVSLPMLFRVPGTNGRSYDALLPSPAIANAARVGHADIHPDPDGVVRRMDLALDGEQRWLHMVALAAREEPRVAGAIAALPDFTPRRGNEPLQRHGAVLIDFAGGGGHIRTIPFISVLRGELPVDFVRNSYVLVGATAAGLGDQFSTPTNGASGLMPGVEIQAYLLDTLQSGRGATEAGALSRIGTGAVAVVLLVWAFGRLRPSGGALAGLAMVLLMLLASALLLRGFHIWLPPAAAIITLIAAQPLWAWRRLSAVSSYMVEELTRLTDNGDTLAVAGAGVLAKDDQVSLQIALMRQTIARVRDLRALVTTALQSLPDPTVMVATDGRIALANDAAIALFGNGAPVTPAMIDHHFNQGEASLPAFAPAAITDPAQPWTGEHFGADGSIRDVRMAMWRDAQGQTIGWVVRFTDISQLRRAERQREEALQLLTHDMRAPQASILALLAQHGSNLQGQLAGRLRHYATRTIELADGFLQLAKADAGQYELVPLDLGDILIEAVDDLWPQLSAQRITLVTDGADTEHLVNGSRSLLTRALVNLIGNAIKFSEPGSTITCVMKRDASDQAHPKIVCSIIDTGAGMSPDIVAGLFSRFRHREPDRQNPQGIGLGLAFVHSVVTNHGGSIRCESQPGKGSRFDIRLPEVASA